MHLRKYKPIEKVLPNNTTRFLLPSLQLSYKKLESNGFVNAYVSDHTYEVLYDKHLYLLFNPHKFTREFDKFCDELRSHQLFEDEYDCEGPYGKVMFVFRIPKPFESIIELFKKGEYSKFPPTYISNCFKKFKSDGSLSSRWKVLTRHPDLKKELEERLSVKNTQMKSVVVLDETAEYWNVPKEQEEIHNYNPMLETETWGKILTNQY